MKRFFDWSKFTAIMVVVVPAIITVFNLALFYRLIPVDFTLQHVMLSFDSPNSASVFLSNYAHRDFAHLAQNMVAYIFAVCAIIWLALVGVKNIEFHYDVDTKTLVKSTLVFFIIVPFVVSGASLLVAPIIGMEGYLVGFSGVGFAFIGYLIYTMETLLVGKIRVMKEKKDIRRVYIGYALTVVAIVIPVIFMNLVLHTNYIGHLTGYVCGLAVPFFIHTNLNEVQE